MYTAYQRVVDRLYLGEWLPCTASHGAYPNQWVPVLLDTGARDGARKPENITSAEAKVLRQLCQVDFDVSVWRPIHKFVEAPKTPLLGKLTIEQINAAVRFYNEDVHNRFDYYLAGLVVGTGYDYSHIRNEIISLAKYRNDVL